MWPNDDGTVSCLAEVQHRLFEPIEHIQAAERGIAGVLPDQQDVLSRSPVGPQVEPQLARKQVPAVRWGAAVGEVTVVRKEAIDADTEITIIVGEGT